MQQKNIWPDRLKFFVLGMVSLFALLLLAGAIPNSSTPTLNYGRYQISAWGAALGNDSGAMGVFIVDTVSGETKTVYSRTYGGPQKTEVVKNDLKKPFISIR